MMGVEIIAGDCREELRKMDADSIHCVATSPPYFGLRDYGKDGQIGLEETPDEYIAALVDVFREVRRVLRKDGVVFLNIGDSYAGSGKGAWKNKTDQKEVYVPDPDSRTAKMKKTWPGIKAKDRMMIPARAALALQADGWWLRDEIIWHKPNPMPISVTDRTTPAHEMVYMLSKSSRYFYNMEAMKEPIADSSRKRYAQPTIADQQGGAKQDAYENGFVGQRSRSRRPNEILKSLADGGSEMRQPRSVWSIPTKPFPGAHFATFPPALVEKMILAGCPVGGTVLDPFGGSGTTGVVANQLGRNAILIDLNHEYVEMARERINGPLFAGAK